MNVNDIDITADIQAGALVEGGSTPNAQPGDGGAAQLNVPAGSQPAHGKDAQPTSSVDPVTAATEDKSVRELLSSAFKDGTDKPVDQANATNAGTALSPLTQDGEGKWRNADGTFANAEQIAAFNSASAAPADAPFKDVLSTFTPVEAQQFQALPAQLQEFLGRRMDALNTQASRYSEYAQLENVLGPRRQAWEQQGSNTLVALNQLFSLSDFAGKSPDQFVMWFADQHKLDLDALLDARDAANANVDPKYQQLEQTVNQLQSQLSTRQQQEQQEAHNQRLEVVNRFSTEKDEAGQLKRPYLTDVVDDFTAQIAALRQTNPTMPHDQVLQKAYENACWANATVRGKMQEALQASQRKTDEERVAQAKKAGSSITGAPASAAASPNNSNRSLREELESQFQSARA